MKNNAVARIIIFSIVIVILLGILFTGLGVGMFMFNLRSENITYNTAESNTCSIDPSEIRNIEIEWVSGSVDIQAGDIDTITFTESGNISENRKMVWNVSNDTLSICYEKPSVYFGFVDITDKDLTITVPATWICENLSIEVASAEMEFQDFQATEVEIDTASGKCDFIDCNIEILDVDSASGFISYTGSLNALDCDTASGSFEGVFTNTPNRIQMDSASADLELTLPQGSGFRVTMDALSGKFHSDQDVNYDGDSYIYGDQHCIIDFDGASGSIWIHEK